MLGCCADKPYGTGCTEKTCMRLPIGETCGSCGHFKRCSAMFGATSGDDSCGWFPRRFKPVEPARLVAGDNE